MLHACVQRFNVMFLGKTFWKLKQGLTCTCNASRVADHGLWLYCACHDESVIVYQDNVTSIFFRLGGGI